VKDAQGGPAYGRTNWRRFAIAMGVPAVVAGGLIAATATGALAAGITVSSTEFKLSADNLTGEGFTQYSGAFGSADGGKVVALSGIKHAKLTNMCQTVKGPSPFGGSVVIRIEAGGGNKAVDAEDLLIGMSDLKGDARFEGIQIGLDSSTLNADGAKTHGQVGGFGQQATTVKIDGLQQTASYTTAGVFTLNGMKLHLYAGKDAAEHECF
jgi:uncharacterized protein DUF6230